MPTKDAQPLLYGEKTPDQPLHPGLEAKRVATVGHGEIISLLFDSNSMF